MVVDFFSMIPSLETLYDVTMVFVQHAVFFELPCVYLARCLGPELSKPSSHVREALKPHSSDWVIVMFTKACSTFNGNDHTLPNMTQIGNLAPFLKFPMH
jgi:hypothetical protein